MQYSIKNLLIQRFFRTCSHSVFFITVNFRSIWIFELIRAGSRMVISENSVLSKIITCSFFIISDGNVTFCKKHFVLSEFKEVLKKRNLSCAESLIEYISMHLHLKLMTISRWTDEKDIGTSNKIRCGNNYIVSSLFNLYYLIQNSKKIDWLCFQDELTNVIS